MLGRQEEQARCRDRLRAGGGALICGPAGIGKSLLLESLASDADRAGDLVLRTAPTAAEAGLPYLALLDLFGGVSAQTGAALPGHLRSALDSAFLRSSPVAPTDQLAIRIAVVELARLLARDRPVLLAIDDAQWVDQPSADVLGFLARRVSATNVRVLVAERVDEHTSDPACVDLCPRPLEVVPLQPLPPHLIRRLIAPGPATDRVCQASGGNPLYAIELARSIVHNAVLKDPDGPLVIPDTLRLLLADRLQSLPPQAMPALRLVAAAARPGPGLLAEHDPGLRAAVQARILTVDPDGSPRFGHPLLAELVYGDATVEQRRSAHARLADLVEDPIERVRHRALSVIAPDAALADELFEASLLARDRGAPGLASSLARLSEGHTAAPALAAARLLAAAEHAYVAGNSELARSACEAVLRRHDRAARVGARLLLMEISGASPAVLRQLGLAASADAGDDPLLAGRVRTMLADLAVRESGIAAAAGEIAEAERAARIAGDPDLLIQALALRVPVELQNDAGQPLSALDEAIELARGRPLSDASVWVRLGHAVVLLRRGETSAAVAEVGRLRADVERAGRSRDLCRVLYTMSSVYERAGRCREAAEAARLCGLLWSEVGLPPAGGLTLRGAAELTVGTAEEAIELLTVAVRSAETTGDPEWLAYAHAMLGRAHWLRFEHAIAARHLGRAQETLHGLGYHDPAMVLIHADLAEALAHTGELAQARRVIAQGRAAAERQRREVVRLGLDRAAAFVDGLAGDPRTAADRFRPLIPASHGYPLEIARALLTLAALERRGRRRAAARSTLERAMELFAAAGCETWLRHARQQLDQLEVTAVPARLDDRLTQLVLAGVTNRAIAHELHLSVKAVEANLTRLYRRHGVSGRTELARLSRL